MKLISSISIRFLLFLFSFLFLTSCGYYNATITEDKSSTSSTAPQNPTTPPTASSLSATLADSNIVNISWTASSGDSSIGYTVYRSTTSGIGFSALTACIGLSVLTCQDTTTLPGTTYYYKVISSYTNNSFTLNTSTNSNEVSVTTAVLPSAPTGLTLDISNPTSWILSWTSSTTGTAPITYTVSRTTTYGSGYIDIPICFNLGTTSCSDTTISADRTYCYKVAANNIGGSALSTEICPPLSTPPTITLTTNNSILIPSTGGAPPLTYSIDSGTGSINSQTGIFKTTSSGSTSIKVTDAKNNIQTISVNNLKIRLDGYVNAMIQNGTSLYVGGNFTTVNPTDAPQMIALNATTGKPNFNCDLQSGFNGAVIKVLATNNALYVGGSFTQYRGQSANRLAKLNLPYCDLDTTFSPPANNGFSGGFALFSVLTLAASSTSLYVGGDFTAYKGIANSANYIAKLDLNTGAIDTTFSPVGATSNGFNFFVNTLAISGSSLYVGGQFSAYKGVANSSFFLAKLNLNTGDIDTTFSPVGAASNGFNSFVNTLVASGSSLYVGGQFTAYKGVANSANRIAKLDLITGTIDTTFSPVGAASNGFDNTVNCLEVSGSSLYVGGQFTAYKGISNSANKIAKLDLTTGTIDTTFSPVGVASNGFNSIVNSLAVSDSSLYVGGQFTAYKGIANSANHLAKLDLTTGNLDTVFSPPSSNGFNSGVNSLAVSGTNLYITGAFSFYKGNANSANRIAKFDLTTGDLDTTFSPPSNNGFDSDVNSLAVSGTSLYVGGAFTAYKGIANSANYLAKLDLTTGAIDTTFSPVGATSNGFEYNVNSLAVSGTSLYVGGLFINYKGITNSANRLAKLDLNTGEIDTTFSPIGVASNGFNSNVNSLAVSGSSLYVGGSFTDYKGITNSANRLAKLNLTTGAIDTTFSPVGGNSNGFGGGSEVYILLASGSSLYVGGGFVAYKGVANSANRIAKLDLTTGAIDTVFSPVGATSNGFNNNVISLAVSGSSLYVGGWFTAYKGVASSANRIAKLDLNTGAIDTTFSPVGAASNGFNNNVNAIATTGSSLYVGGWFSTYRGTQRANYLVPLDLTNGTLLDP